MDVIYIAGPITGVEDFEVNFKVREAALRQMGYGVVNPVKLSKSLEERKGTKDLAHSDYMQVCLERLLECNGISMLPGWEQSEGASLEHEVAVATNKKIVDVRMNAPRWQHF